MANTRELRRRIKSVTNTAQITKAMQMVSATKMRRAQGQALNGRPYSLNLSFALERLLPLIDTSSHPLLTGNSSKITGVALLSTDKSMCGALNTNLFRLLTTSDLLSSDSAFYTIGMKGRNFIARTGKNLLADFENSDTVTFRQASQLAKLIIDSFMEGEIGEAYLVYPHFLSTLRQEATKVKLLPIDYSELVKSLSGSETPGKTEKVAEKSGNEFLFEPDPKELLNFVLNHFVQIKIYQSMLETKASEHSSRMITMQNATDNALDLVADLKLANNKIRQDSITKELLEITTAAIAMQ